MRTTPSLFAAVLGFALSSTAAAEPLRCDLAQYKPAPGLTAILADTLLALPWRGDANNELRLRLAIVERDPPQAR